MDDGKHLDWSHDLRGLDGNPYSADEIAVIRAHTGATPRKALS